MTTAALQTEDILWAVYDALTAQLPAALAAVEASRTRMPLALPLPQRIGFGADDPRFLSDASYPRVMLLGAPRDTLIQDSVRATMTAHMLLVEWYILVPYSATAVLDDLKDQAVMLNARYGEAVLAVINDNGPYGGFDPVTAVPGTQEGQPALLALDPQNTQHLSGYLAGTRCSIPMRGLYVR